MPTYDLSIIIVNYNVKYYLEQCLHSIWASSKQLLIEVFIVDNASSDESIPYLQKIFPASRFPHLHFICNQTNIGFGRANNLALKKAKGEYVLFLNPDTILTEDTLNDCITFAKAHPNLGGLGVKMLKDGGGFALESRRGLPTPWVAFCKMIGLSQLFPKNKTFGKYYLSYQPLNENQSIEIISGAFMMLSQKGIKATHGFDPQFFMYGEDIDLSYRLLLAHLENYFVNTPILHYKGESTHKNTFKYVHVFYEAMLIFFKKHYPRTSNWLKIPITIGIVLRAILTLIIQQYRSLKTFLFPFTNHTISYGLYIGNHTSSLVQLAQRNALQMDTQTEIPNEPLKKEYDFIAFDAEDFTFKDILNYFEHSTHRQYIGLYYPTTNILITGSDIFRNDYL